MIDYLVDMLHASSPILVLLAGLSIGALHAFEPDHIAAVSNQMARQHGNQKSIRRSLPRTAVRASVLGALWGAGHTMGISAMGFLMVVFSSNLPDGLFAGMEIVVGLMLILLGSLAALNRGILHTHPHRHADGTVHTHRHDHENEHTHRHGSYIIGCIHGIAGSGILVALLASGLGDVNELFYFLVMFGAGSIMGMVLASGIIGIPLAISSAYSAQRLFRVVTASVTIIIGAVVIYQTVLGFGFLP